MQYDDFETFHSDNFVDHETLPEHGQPLEPGWYWWFRFPGGLPDDEPWGPYETEKEAHDDAVALHGFSCM